MLSDDDLLVGIVKLYSKFGRKYRLRGWSYASISTYLILRQCGQRPAWLCQYFPENYARYVRVDEGGGICVLRLLGYRIEVLEDVGGFGLRPMLREVVGLIVFPLRRRFEKEGCWSQTNVGPNGSAGHSLGRFSSNIAPIHASWNISGTGDAGRRAKVSSPSDSERASRRRLRRGAVKAAALR